ncbi:MAG TPA: MFS transporter, partial [Romboutsia sp.]|nr:MFS transporter [Romboutsia sp.]
IAFFIIGFASITHLFTFTDIKEKTTSKYCAVAMSIVNLSEFVGVGVINLFIGYVFENINVNAIDLYRISFTVFIGMSIIAIIAGHIGSKK